MARVEKRRKPQPIAQTPLQALMRDHLHALEVQNYSEFTVRGRAGHIGVFLAWLEERGITEPLEVTRPVLERYQRHLFHHRKANGDPLSFRSQHARLVPLRMWFRWMTRQNFILHNPASELELPRLGRSLPKNIFSAAEVERIMVLCEIDDPIGLRDRALLEVLYSTGIRRLEVGAAQALRPLARPRPDPRLRARARKTAMCRSESGRSRGLRSMSAKAVRSSPSNRTT